MLHFKGGSPTTDAFQINKIMDELERAKVFEVVVTGGEPLLNKSGLFQILDRVESSDFMFSAINSNLLNLNIFDAQRLAGYQRLGRILTSLMGHQKKFTILFQAVMALLIRQ